MLSHVNQLDVKKYGLIPELIGRFPVLTYLHPLNKETLLSILTDPQNALTKQYIKLFEMDEVDRSLLEAGVAVDLQAMRSDWREALDQVLAEARLSPPSDDAWMHSGGRSGRHSEHLGHLLATMQILPRSYPDANW